jgi:NADH-quinone oxidoreductase subunit F
MDKIVNPEQLNEWKEEILSRRPEYKKTIVISSGTCGQASGSLPVVDAINEELEKRRLKETVGVEITGCHGFCELEPNIIIYPEEIFYGNLEPKDIPAWMDISPSPRSCLIRLRKK